MGSGYCAGAAGRATVAARDGDIRSGTVTRRMEEGWMKTVIRDKQWAEKYPELGMGPVPTEPYYSNEHYELERDRIFRRCWINVGRVDDIPEPGDYFVRDLTICKVSVLIIRGFGRCGARLPQRLLPPREHAGAG